MPSLIPPQPCLQSGSSVLVGSDKGSGGGFLNFFPLDMITDQAVRQGLALNSELCWDAGWDPLLQLQTVRVAQQCSVFYVGGSVCLSQSLSLFNRFGLVSKTELYCIMYIVLLVQKPTQENRNQNNNASLRGIQRPIQLYQRERITSEQNRRLEQTVCLFVIHVLTSCPRPQHRAGRAGTIPALISNLNNIQSQFSRLIIDLVILSLQYN